MIFILQSIPQAHCDSRQLWKTVLSFFTNNWTESFCRIIFSRPQSVAKIHLAPFILIFSGFMDPQRRRGCINSRDHSVHIRRKSHGTIIICTLFRGEGIFTQEYQIALHTYKFLQYWQELTKLRLNSFIYDILQKK